MFSNDFLSELFCRKECSFLTNTRPKNKFNSTPNNTSHINNFILFVSGEHLYQIIFNIILETKRK